MSVELIAGYLTRVSNAIKSIRKSITTMGVDASSAPLEDLDDMILAIPQEGGGTGWSRPADRPAVPTVNENEVYILFGVTPTGPNDYALYLQCTDTADRVTIDWGDGNTETSSLYYSNVTHVFDYNSLSVTPNADGIKWVWIKYSSSSFASINIQTKPATSVSGRPSASYYVPSVYEMYLKCPQLTSLGFTSGTIIVYRLLEVFHMYGTNEMTSFNYFLRSNVNLKSLVIDTSKGTNFSYFLYNCSGFNVQLSLDTSAGTNFSGFMRLCTAFNQPLDIDTSKGTDFNYFLGSCASFNQSLNLVTGAGTNFAYFMNSCSSFAKSITLDLSSATTALGTQFFGTSSYALIGLRLLNMGQAHTAINISNSNMTASALADLFNDLFDRAAFTTGTITISNSFGASALTEEQRLIANAKNWDIVG